MANFQLSKRYNLFSHWSAEKNQENLPKTQEFEKKNSRVWGPIGPNRPPKSAQKQACTNDISHKMNFDKVVSLIHFTIFSTTTTYTYCTDVLNT